MKPQDIIFLIAILGVIYKKNSRAAALLGCISLLFSIPLFAGWIFFTAERLNWYAAGFFTVSMAMHIKGNHE